MKQKCLVQKCREYFKNIKPRGMQSTIMLVFSSISVSVLLILGVMMYLRFSAASREEMIRSTEKLMEQTGENMEDYLVTCGRYPMRFIIT